MNEEKLKDIFLYELGLAIQEHGMIGSGTIAAREAAAQIVQLVETELACYKAFIEGMEETTTGIYSRE